MSDRGRDVYSAQVYRDGASNGHQAESVGYLVHRLSRKHHCDVKGMSMDFSPARTRTRRSTGVERPVGTVPRYIPRSGRAPIAMFSTLPSAICATSKTPKSSTGWPVEFKRRTA